MMMNSVNDPLLIISIKPQFAKKIFSGEKTVELRKSAPLRAKKGTTLLIYVTSPIKELWGVCTIDKIIKDTPKQLWIRIGKQSGISKTEFFNYYKDVNFAYGIEIINIRNFTDNSIKLESLKEEVPGFSPPQTYRYINKAKFQNSNLAKLLNI